MSKLESERDVAVRAAAATDSEISAKVKAANLELQTELFKVTTELKETRRGMEKEVRGGAGGSGVLLARGA